MAKLIQGILGPFSGKVGTVVGYLWKGRPLMRAYQRQVRYPNTPRQQAERGWFVQMVRFAAEARGALLLGLREAAAREQMTEGNLFVKRNKACFALDGAVDYRQLVFAAGTAPVAAFEGYEVEPCGVLTVRYGRGVGRGQDKVYVYAYCPDLGRGLLSAPGERRDGAVRMALPDEWVGRGLAVYAFCVDASGRASRSVYLEPLRASEPEIEEGMKPLEVSSLALVAGVGSVLAATDASWSSGRQSPL